MQATMLIALLLTLFVILVSSADDKCRRVTSLQPTTSFSSHQTMFNEGMCLCCYYETNNIPSIAVGFNLQSSDAAQVMEKYGLQLDSVLQDCQDKTNFSCLTESNARDLFNFYTYPEFAKCADAYVPDLPSAMRAAIIDVAFAGCDTLNKLVSMQVALKKHDWATAGAELRNSFWCAQVKEDRCYSDYSCITASECQGETCDPLVTQCSSNSECRCFKTSDGTGFCANDLHCSDVPDCRSCSPGTSVCILESCCGSPKCIPLSSGDTCKDPPSRPQSTLQVREHSNCLRNSCVPGNSCKLRATGFKCV